MPLALTAITTLLFLAWCYLVVLSDYLKEKVNELNDRVRKLELLLMQLAPAYDGEDKDLTARGAD